jgi:hypothetical protein
VPPSLPPDLLENKQLYDEREILEDGRCPRGWVDDAACRGSMTAGAGVESRQDLRSHGVDAGSRDALG